MLKVIGQLDAGKYTVLSFDDELPPNRNGLVEIEGKEYKTEIVYDMPKSIGILGKGDFVGKTVEFV